MVVDSGYIYSTQPVVAYEIAYSQPMSTSSRVYTLHIPTQRSLWAFPTRVCKILAVV
jgi:hypothetical protein